MKKLFFLIATTLLATNMMAQNYPTKFLGIPIEGTKQEMIQKIRERGFTYNRQLDCLTGVFNGEKVVIGLRAYEGKVCQVMVGSLQTYSEKQIKAKFNNLMKLFNEDPYYISTHLDQKFIDKKEKISKEMSKNSKKYAAYYMQITHDLDTTILMKDMEKIAQDVAIQFADKDSLSEREKDLTEQYIELKAIRRQYTNNIVWFRILENQGKYSIALYYDNLYNRPSKF